MRQYRFPYFISFGKLDNTSAEIDCMLTDKEANRLEESANMGGRFRLDEDDFMEDIFYKVLEAIYAEEKAALLQTPDFFDDFDYEEDEDEEEYLDWDNLTLEQKIDAYLDSLMIGINYPEHLQHLPQTVKRNTVQSEYESIVVERDALPSCLSGTGDTDKIIYTDGGDTLFAIPIKYAGVFVVPSGVKHIETKAFKGHRRITDVIIENGIEEIPEWAFRECAALEHVSVPQSVKTIASDAFSQCKALCGIDLCEGLLAIYPTAFRLCSKLHELRVPATVIELDLSITSYWNSIETIYIEGMQTQITDQIQIAARALVLYVKQGSAAEQFAKQNHKKYVLF